jgi:hypothetical protein
MLALWAMLVGDSFNELVALTVVLSALTLMMVFVLLRRYFGIEIAYASVIILAVNPAMVLNGGAIASEAPYSFLTIVCFYCLTRADYAQGLLQKQGEMKIDKSALAWLVAVAVVAIASALTRTVGVTLVGAIALHLSIGRRWKATSIFVLASMLTIGGWIAWTILAEEQFVGRSYIADLESGIGGGELWLIQLLKRIGSNGWFYATWAVPEALAVPSISGTEIDNVISVAVLASTMLVGLSVFLRRWRSAALYLFAYGAVLLVWRWHLDRLLVPALVFLVPLALTGGVALARRLFLRSPQIDRTVLIAMVVVLAGSGIMGSLTLIRASASCDRTGAMPRDECVTPAQASYFAALRFVDRNLLDDAVFMTVKSSALFYYTGRRSISVERALAQDESNFAPFLRRQGAQYILLSSVDDGGGSLPNRLEANCEMLEIIQSFTPRTVLFKLNLESGGDRVRNTFTNGCEAVGAYRAHAEVVQ